MDGLKRKTLLKWMIWGYHYFWKHPCMVIFGGGFGGICHLKISLFGLVTFCITFVGVNPNPGGPGLTGECLTAETPVAVRMLRDSSQTLGIC